MRRKPNDQRTFAESVADLKTALKALNAHRAEAIAANGDDVDSLGYVTDHIKRHIMDSAYKASMAEGLIQSGIEVTVAEAGAKFSAATRTQLQSVVTALDSLLNPVTDDTGADLPIPDETTAEVRTVLDEFVNDPQIAEAITAAKDPIVPAKVGPDTTTGPTIEEAFNMPAGSKVTSIETAHIIAESAGSSDTHPAFDMLVIQAGMSKNMVMYREDVLRKSLPLLEGRPIYVDHPEAGSGARSLARKVGWWDNPRMEEVDGHPSVVARANIMENSGQPWFLPMVREAIDRGHPEMVGISILAGGETIIKRGDTGPFKEVLEVKIYASADAVSEPGAGGRPLSLVASEGIDADVKKIAECKSFAEVVANFPDMTTAQIKEARPDLFDDAGTPIMEVREVVKEVIKEVAPATSPELVEGMDELRRFRTQTMLDAKLLTSGLPKATQARVRARVGEQILAEAALDTIVQEFADITSEINAAAPAGSMQQWRVPYGKASVGITIAEQLQLASDQFFGAEIADDMKGKFTPIRSFREFYMAVTGDREFRGVYDPEYSVVAESLPTATLIVGGPAITMSNLVGTSMNRALTGAYKGQSRWWEPIATKGPLENFKQQDRIRLAAFGSLTERTVDGEEYIELPWDENAEDWAPTEFGNIVTIGRRMIINDDMRGVQRLPSELAKAATRTLNEYVSALISAGTYSGIVMADGYRVFDSAHQGNKLDTAMSRANVIAAMKVMMAMTDDASKIIGVAPKYLLHSLDHFDTAFEILNTGLVPDSANNARNVIASPLGLNGQSIQVPQWVGTDHWFLAADPNELPCLEMGFLFGREEPELLSQMDPTSGMVFNNDVIAHKVRFDFGGSITDYRGLVRGK